MTRIFRYIPNVELAWDEQKSQATVVKHGISFAQAVAAFDDPAALLTPDAKHSTSTEERQWLIGEADMGITVVVFTLRRSGHVFRIISARPANRKERRRYEENRGISL